MANDIKTPELMDEERKQRAAHAAEIGEATLEVEQVLLKHNLSWADWGEVIDTLNARTQIVFGQLKVKQINDLYGKHS